MLSVEELSVPTKSNNSEYREALPAAKYRDKLIRRYGEKGKSVLFAEAFQVSEYGKQLTEENEKVLFPF